MFGSGTPWVSLRSVVNWPVRRKASLISPLAAIDFRFHVSLLARGLEDVLASASLGGSSRVAVRIGYHEPLAHRLNAAADIALTPSRFEPLSAMYAMRCGAPVTGSVGGLTDTVVDVARECADEEGATGFTFSDATADELTACVKRACAGFGNKTSWRRIQRNAMDRDFSWNRSAQRYLAVYRNLLRAGVWTASEPQSAGAFLG